VALSLISFGLACIGDSVTRVGPAIALVRLGLRELARHA
jgi:hypothetical protein